MAPRSALPLVDRATCCTCGERQLLRVPPQQKAAAGLVKSQSLQMALFCAQRPFVRAAANDGCPPILLKNNVLLVQKVGR
jgi:hypothetical protein